jgi:alkanesulfonate monooxygenase SsuD/methylene tetrahydromethanopterin reductase-like flavin-dependent oxidoreductase (luciferase family)
VILSVETVCADTDAEAAVISRPSAVLRARILATGNHDEPELLPPAKASEYEIPPEIAEQLAQRHAHQAHGGPDRVIRSLTDLAAATGADELMLMTPVYDAAVRARSYELVAKGFASAVS